jgi:hypothetical protein
VKLLVSDLGLGLFTFLAEFRQSHLGTVPIEKRTEMAERQERRNISRVEYKAKSVIVVCETGERYFVETKNVSPLGMGIIMSGDSPDLVGKDIIIVASTLIMYADVNRQEKNEDGTFTVGISAREFTPEVLQYLFNHISG